MVAKYWKNTAGAYIKSGGAYVKCEVCPCGVDCCFDDAVPLCLAVGPFAGLADSGPCTNCNGLNTTQQITWDSSCTWRLLPSIDPLCIDGFICVGDNTALVQLTIVEASPTECTVTLILMPCSGGSVTTYESTLLKSDTLPWTLSFVSEGADFCTGSWPATVGIGTC